MGIEFLMLCEGEQLRGELQPAIYPFPRRRDVGAHAFWFGGLFLREPQARFDHCKQVPEIMGDAACHFTQCG
jgi:hypothetical protein